MLLKEEHNDNHSDESYLKDSDHEVYEQTKEKQKVAIKKGKFKEVLFSSET